MILWKKNHILGVRESACSIMLVPRATVREASYLIPTWAVYFLTQMVEKIR